ncbi:unnamed protein product, partial [Vitis vinifera]
MLFMLKAVSLFVSFGMWEEFQTQNSSQMGKLQYLLQTRH